MADKELTEAAWKAFDKDKKYKSDALLKALRIFSTLDKGGQGLGAEKLKALKDIEDESDALRKATKDAKDAKELGAQLKKIEDAVARQRKETEREMREMREEGQAQEEEADSPALLGKKMVPLLRELRKGEARMNAMICTAGKATAVLIMRRSISPSRFKLLTEFVDAAGGAKKIVGECVFEAGALTFVVQSPAGGLAKRLRQALLDQTELKFKVKVRGEDGAEDHDGEEGEEDEGEQPGAAGELQQPGPAGAPASAEALEYTQRLRKLTPHYDEARLAKHPELVKLTALMGMASERANKEPPDHAGAIKALMALEKLLDVPLPTKAGGVDADAAFNARLAALLPKIKAALAAGAPAAQDVKLRASEAGALARQHDHAGAQAMLDLVEKLLGDLPSAPDGKTEVPPAPPLPPSGDLKALQAELTNLVRQIPAIAATQPERLEPLKALAAQAAAAVKSGDGAAAEAAVQALSEAVASTPGKIRSSARSTELIAIWRDAKELVDARMTTLRTSVLAHPDPALKATLAQIAEKGLSGLGGVTAGATVGMMTAMMDVENAPVQARQAVEKFRAFLASDIARGIDENPFKVAVDLRRTLGAALEQIESRLAA